MTGPSGDLLHWRRLYLAVTLAGAGVGLLVALGALPYIPPQLTGWVRQVGAASAVVVLGLAGLHWQLRRRSSINPGD